MEFHRPSPSFRESSVPGQKFLVLPNHHFVYRLDFLLHRQPFIGCLWLRRRPCFKHSRRPVHGGIFNPNSDHPNLPPLLAERIPKRPMRGSPRVEFGIRLVTRIDVGKGDGFRVHGKGQFERKVALLVASHTVVNPARNQAERQAELFKKLDLLRLGGEPVHTRMFQNKIKRQEPSHDIPLAGALSGAETVRAEEIELSVPDGRRVTTLINATPIHGEDGAVASVVVTMQDLAPLQALERMRAEFLGMVSHELRGPLTSIKGSTAAALGAARLVAPAETREFFRIIDDQADRMIGLIADLLDAGRIEAGTLSVAPEPSEVAALVEQARGTFISGGGRHAVGIDLPPVLADRQRIVQVLNNLLANAARHAPDTAAIRIAAARDGEHVAVSVADEGRGIAPEHLGQLFRKYAAAGDREGGVGGGLGLAICKGLVEAHGGRIRAESGGVGLGTRVTFTIPMAGPADDDAVSGRAARRAAATDAMPILVVDDDPGTLRHVRDTLTEAGYAPLVTGDPRELSRILRTEKPRLVLLDLMLPGTDGIQLMQTVPELADLPVIFHLGLRARRDHRAGA